VEENEHSSAADLFTDYISAIENPVHRERLRELLNWVAGRFPQLKPRIAWNQPIFTDHGTYIIGFSRAAGHIAVAPERAVIEAFSRQIKEAGYEHSKELVRIRWQDPVVYPLLERIISHNITEKAECTAFWRPRRTH
jgi:uncharacterized protein